VQAEKTRFSKIFDDARTAYGVQLRSFMNSAAKRKNLKRLLIVLFILMYALPMSGILRTELFPPEDADSFAIDLQKDFGTPLEQTQLSITSLAEELYADERVASLVINSGFSGALGSQSGGGEGSHLAHIMVNLNKDRDQASFDVLDEYQEKFASAPQGTISVTQPGYGPGAAAPVELTITGDDLKTLDELAAQITTLVSSIEGTQNVKSSVISTNGQFVTYIDRARAAQYGVTASDVAFVLRTAVNGVSATEISQDGEDVDVTVRYGLSNAAFAPETVNKRSVDLSTIEGLTISTREGNVPLLALADIRLDNSRSGISHEDTNRVVKVTSYLSSAVSPAQVFGAIDSRLSEIELPEGYTVAAGGEDEETQESLNDMFRAMILAAILIAALMVLQFQSFRQAFIILTTIPLALIGVFPGLLLVGQPLSFPGMIGIVALAGIVVNNAIILIDKINLSQKQGMNVQDALVAGGQARLEPIILTTITTVFGILPLALTQPLWASLGYAIIFGLLFSTMLTLFVVPLLYNRLYKNKK